MVDYRQALPAGFVLAGDYRINGVLGQGGFGITYKAEDLRLGAPVAIKEYFPSELAVRDGGSTVEPRSVRDQRVLEWGRVKFLEEARTLARFRHPSIVRVSRLFEANNTAYIVLDFEMGPSLAEWRADLGRDPSQAEVDRIAAKLLDAVAAVHDAGILHRDIKPANVIMRDGVEPVLIDFGAARQALSAQSKTVHAIVTPGYSPKEQYAVDLDRQGPWSDIYALGATLYFLVTGRPPPDALSRELGEEMQTAASAVGSWRTGFLAAIDQAMSLNSEARPQSMAEWREMLFSASPTLGGRRGREASTVVASGTSRPLPAAALPSARSVAPSAPRRVSFDDLPKAGAGAEASRGRSRGLVFSSILIGLLAIGGLGYWIVIEAPARDEAAWQRAASADTVAAYERYVAEQPSGRHVTEARQRLSAIQAFASAAAGAGRTASDATSGSEATANAADVSSATPAGTAPSNASPTATSDEPTPSEQPAQSATSDPPPAPTTANPSADVATTPPPPPAPKQLASHDARVPPATGVASDAAISPAPEPPAAPTSSPRQSDATGPFRARAELPPAISQDDVARIASAVPAATWRFAIESLGDGRVPGFTDQSSDFIAELKRISGDKLDLTPLAADRTIPSGELLQRLATNRDLVAWQGPLAQAGRHLEFAVFSGAVPFGLNPSDHVRWLRSDGARLLEETFAETGTPLRAIPCGVAGGVGAWFKKEVRSPSDFRNLKVRAPRVMAEALTKLGARTVTLQSSRELAAAFTGNRLDANFDVTPLTEIFLAQARPASVYHYPGVHNPAYLFTLLIGPDTWSAMAEPQRRLTDEACRRNLDRWAQRFASTESDVLNEIRRQRIVVRPFTGPLREALRKAVDQVLAEESAKSARFKEILESYNRFRN